MLSLDEIIDVLHQHGQRATYGAVGEYLGLIAREVGRRMGERECSFRCSWIVKKETGRPAYPRYSRRDQIDPRLWNSPAPLATGDGLRAFLSNHIK